MKPTFVLSLILSFFILASCDKKSKIEKAVEEIPATIKVDRFEKAFFETAPNDLPKLKQEYPFFFPPGNEDAVWLEKMQHSQWRELYNEVEKQYANFDGKTAEIEDLFKHIIFYFPQTKIPKVYTVISEMDYHNKVIYTGDMLIISLELYLGSKHRFYEFPTYLTQNFTSSQILPDIAASFAQTKVTPPSDLTFLSQMIYNGKQLYLKDLLLPEFADADKIGYSQEQLAWCRENEGYIWRYFIENNLLYDSDQKLMSRFISPAPFSKFYLEIDNESPGRVGTWIGWQIARSYMENNKVSLNDFLKKDAKEIFEKSKYKPKK